MIGSVLVYKRVVQYMDRKKVCRFFERGSCKKEKCPFVHLNENRKVCEFYKKGFCRKGANCNFYHPPKEDEQIQTAKRNDKPPFAKKQKKPYQQPKQQAFQHQEEQLAERQKHQSESDDQRRDEGPQRKQEQREVTSEEERMREAAFKSHQIDMMLGLASDDESEEEAKMVEVEIDVHSKKRNINFHKIYPKRFPDYSKHPETKQKVLQNDEKFFQKQKFVDFINKITDPAQKEYYQIVRKFQDSFTLEDQGNPKVYLLNLRPLLFEAEIKLHFEMVQDFIELRIDSSNYPQERALISVRNSSIPEEYKQKLEQWLNRTHEKKSIFDTLKTFLNNFQKIYDGCKQKLENEYYSQIQLESKIQKKLSVENEAKIERKVRRAKRAKDQSERQRTNPYVEVIKYEPAEKINVGNMNYTITINSLLLANCEYVVAEKLLLFLECQCEQSIIHILEADRKQMKIGVKLKCKKCKMVILIALQREVMQIRSEVIGRMGLENARLVEVGGIGWKMGCSCDNELMREKIYMPGQRLNINCHLCFKNMTVSFMGLKFSNPYYKEGSIPVDGKQLPNKGACKHKKQSFRWVRYGCCGRSFSCDDCHATHSLHQKVEGITMLCGFCSIEQPIAKQCIHCKKQLVRGVDKSGHWEGGLGCRDQTLLSRKDAKKYSGLTKKKQK